MSLVDVIIYAGSAGLLIAFLWIVRSYGAGLRQSPRDLWLLFATKLIEYTAYAAMNMTFILWLSADCGLGDVEAGAFISAWSLGLSVVGVIAGSLVDTIGIKKTLLLSTALLVFSRSFLFWLTNPTAVMLLGFVPLAIGFAIVAPVVSIGIKRYTTKEGATLGFGLFYVLMNVAFAIGGYLFDAIRSYFSIKDAAGKVLRENAGTMIPMLHVHLSTYQIILFTGLLFTTASLCCIFFLRDGVSMDDAGKVTVAPKPVRVPGPGLLQILAAAGKAARDTASTLKQVARERVFWDFMLIIALTVFTRMIFFHFHYTFPKYALRVLGQGAKIGSIYGVLNPILIVFLVPLVASMTRRVASYKMLVLGTAISSLAVFIGAVPGQVFSGLTQSWLGEIIFVRWLGLAPTMQALADHPPALAYWPLILFIACFTIGEAIWSPRLMQFTVEIAPKGKEGSYLALSVLPFFAAKFVVGPMSGLLVKVYTPASEAINSAGEKISTVGDLSHHYMVWIWIGSMALLSPIGLLIFKKSATRHTS
ncbi:MAG: MFS transporter [Proteobacteria bacterium]|nr:MFS transporter [Pseudomonadota bacterium]